MIYKLYIYIYLPFAFLQYFQINPYVVILYTNIIENKYRIKIS